MNELIKITNGENGSKLVSARELHEFLEVGTPFHKWFPRMTEYGFEENNDYLVTDIFVPNSKGGKQTQVDYAISLEMGKEISMLQRTDKGKEARKYFIQCEKLALEVTKKDRLLISLFSDNKLEVAEAHKQLVIIEVTEATKPLLEKIETDKPIVDFGNQISNSVDSIDVGQFAKLIKDQDIQLGRNKLYEWLRKNKYLQKDNIPYQRVVDMNLFECEEYTYKTPYGEKLGIKTSITGKGQIYLVEKLRKEFKNK